MPVLTLGKARKRTTSPSLCSDLLDISNKAAGGVCGSSRVLLIVGRKGSGLQESQRKPQPGRNDGAGPRDQLGDKFSGDGENERCRGAHSQQLWGEK